MKFITVCLLLFISITGFSQIEVSEKPKSTKVGTVKQSGLFISELSYIVDDKDTAYILVYNNFEYQSITDIQSLTFSSEDNTLEKFYDILKSFFSDENKKNKDYNVNITLGKEKVKMFNFRVMGSTSVAIYTENGNFRLTEKQLDKLFNKNQ